MNVRHLLYIFPELGIVGAKVGVIAQPRSRPTANTGILNQRMGDSIYSRLRNLRQVYTRDLVFKEWVVAETWVAARDRVYLPELQTVGSCTSVMMLTDIIEWQDLVLCSDSYPPRPHIIHLDSVNLPC